LGAYVAEVDTNWAGPLTDGGNGFWVSSLSPSSPSFTAAPTNGAAPLNVTFTDTSTGTITNHSWTFGDGGTSTLTNPSHTYTNAGTFSVALTVSGPGGSATTNAVNLITVTNVPPVASFTASVTDGAAPLDVTFTDTSTGTITNHSWTFGDGGTSALSSPSHTYTTSGTFSVALTVFGPGGSSTTNAVDLITATNVPPVASFTASVTNGAAPLNVTFTDTSTGTITNQLWTFGDGDTSTASSPSHTYTTSGVFSVTLTVFGPLGLNASNPNLITVTNGVNTPPTVSIVRPGNHMLYPSTFTNQTITIVADANDSDGISTIEFFVDAVKLGQTNANPGAILWNGLTVGTHTLTAVAHDTLGATNTSAPVAVTIGAKNSPLGDWEVTIGGADKGVGFVTFEDDFSASGYGIRLKTFGEDDLSGTWGFDAKGRLTGSFIEQLGSATNWTGTLAGSAKSLKSLSASVAAANVGGFRWKGVPATSSLDLSGTWTGVVTIVKVPTPVSYVIRTNATDSAVFDVTTTINTNTVVGQLIATSRNVVYGYIMTGGTNITMSGKFKDRSAKALPDIMTFKGKDETAEKVSIQLSR
jgi:PKD repeat protein